MIGKLGSVDLVANTDTLLYENTTSSVVTANVRFCNRNNSDIKVRIAVGNGGAPAPADYVTYDTPTAANGVLDDTGRRVDPGEKVWVRANFNSVSVRGDGA